MSTVLHKDKCYGSHELVAPTSEYTQEGEKTQKSGHVKPRWSEREWTSQSSHRMAMATFSLTLHHDGKISTGW
jgi:hypothetical protein